MSFSNIYKSSVKCEEPIVAKVLCGDHFSYESVQSLVKIVSLYFTAVELQKCTEQELHFKEIGKKKILLILPGATDLKQIELSEEQQETINTYTKNGLIKVLAVCAGAFFASQSITYYGQKRHEDKKLDLFKGVCYGPAVPLKDPQWKITTGEISLEDAIEPSSGFVTMIGGGAFIPLETHREGREYHVISRYLTLPDRPIAALACVTKNSREYHAVLIGPHVEYDSSDPCFISLKQGFPHRGDEIDAITTDLSKSDSFRKDIFEKVFSLLGLK